MSQQEIEGPSLAIAADGSYRFVPAGTVLSMPGQEVIV
jgi:hypothetical protein